MDDTVLLSRIEKEVTDALGYWDEISYQRSKAQEYYYGEPFGNEVEGRSQYVDSTVQDAIEWIKPTLMRIFASGDQLVQFHPTGPMDVKAAEQATDYVNYVFTKDNPGWEILYGWFHDALLFKNGTVKVWYEDYEETSREEYEGLGDVEFDALIMEDGIEIIDHSMNDDGSHNIVIQRTKQSGRVHVEVVPPEEFMIDRDSHSIDDSRFVAHRRKMTLSDLKEMYPDQEFDKQNLSQGYIGLHTQEEMVRSKPDSYIFPTPRGEDMEESLTEHWVYECYLKTDYDDDGIAELRKVCVVGDIILANDPVDYIPFISITPLKIPHKFYGLSIADVTMPLQRIKSTLMRNLLDNMYNQNYGRFTVLEGQANLDDLLTARPGGIVRVKSPNAVTPLPNPALEPYTFQMLQYLDEVRENRTGVSRTNQGLNPDVLTSHTTATAVQSMMTNSQTRVELIARAFAETGVKQLMYRIYKLLMEYQDQERVVMMRGEWIPVMPNRWSQSMDCTVSVALGNGNKDRQVQELNQVLQLATQAQTSGNPMVTPENMYNIASHLLKAMGHQNVDDYITPVDKQQPPQPSPQDEYVRAQTSKTQSDMQKDQMEIMIKQGKLDLDKQEFEHRKQVDQFEADMKTFEANMEQQVGPIKIG
ncbi:MAG: hypothetical protein VW683_14920 [Betaproteobacteria bacterium]